MFLKQAYLLKCSKLAQVDNRQKGQFSEVVKVESSMNKKLYWISIGDNLSLKDSN